MRPPGRRVLSAAPAAVATLVLSGCAALPHAATDDVRTLAKIDGWRADLVTPPQVFSALEVAYDAETAYPAS